MLADALISPALIARAKKGEPCALQHIYETYGPHIHALAVRMMASASDADDVLHDLFAGLPRALGSYEERGGFESWLRKCTVRLCLMALRRRRRECQLRPEEAEAAQWATRDSVLERIALERALAAIPSHLRVVVVLKDVEGFGHEEIGKILGITPGNSMVRLHRGRKLLRQFIGSR